MIDVLQKLQELRLSRIKFEPKIKDQEEALETKMKQERVCKSRVELLILRLQNFRAHGPNSMNA